MTEGRNDGGAEIGLGDAYGVQTPDDNRSLYRRWADTYETGFIAPTGYVYHQHVVDQFVRSGGIGPVLDVGCGTGIVGVAARAAGVAPIDGVDISPEMLDKARAKRLGEDGGEAAYRDLIEADLTGPTALAAGAYAGVVSAGVFTHGHLGPEALDELVRVAAPSARFALGVNAQHFADRGFAAALDRLHHAGAITAYTLVEVPIYGSPPADADTGALVALFGRPPSP